MVWIVLVGLLLPPAAHSVPGLTARPTNLTCVAPPRPPTGSQINARFTLFAPFLALATSLVQSPLDPEIFYITLRDGRLIRLDAPPGEPLNQTQTVALDLRSKVDLIGEGGLFTIALHPDFASNFEIFVHYGGDAFGQSALVSRVSRFTSSDGGLTFDAAEDVIFELDQPGIVHNGGALLFGPTDGLLYISLGDGGTNTTRATAGDPNTYFGSILRIDIDGGTPYSIPPSNPFATGGGLPEVYATGFRNPWRMGFDTANGDLWVGDVGQDNWEEVDLVVAGENYGWPIREGAHCFPPETPSCSTVGLTDPVTEFSHAVGNVVIGGTAYRGSAIPELQGTYVYSNHISQLYGLFFDGMGMPTRAVIADGPRTNSLATDLDGEIYLLGNTEIRKLIPDTGTPPPPFPQLLSETGCVDPQDPRLPASGLVPYSINVPFWSDGADKERWLALPDTTTIDLTPDGDFEFPIGTVLMKNFRLNGQLFETRLFVRHDDGGWAGYSYEWDQGETEAVLLAANKQIQIQGQTWEFPSRPQCLECHTDAANDALGPETLQLNGSHTYPSTGLSANQLETLDFIGMFTSPLPDPPEQLERLPGTADLSQPLNLRARAYLHSNCSGCHRPGGVIESDMDLRYQATDLQLNACNVTPVQGIDLGIPGARLLVPGDPSTSLISLRMNRRDTQQMPPLGTLEIDTQGVALVDAWIITWLANGATCLGPDSDGDGEIDADDNCDNVSNPNQLDTDMNGIGDACEPPDLIIQGVGGPAAASLGEVVTTAAIAQNIGVGHTLAAVQVSLLLSDDGDIDPLFDTTIGACSTPSLPGGTSDQCTDTGAQIPFDLTEIPSGQTLTFFWGACVDVANAENEDDEANNCSPGTMVQIPTAGATGSAIAGLLSLACLRGFARRRQHANAS